MLLNLLSHRLHLHEKLIDLCSQYLLFVKFMFWILNKLCLVKKKKKKKKKKEERKSAHKTKKKERQKTLDKSKTEIRLNKRRS